MIIVTERKLNIPRSDLVVGYAGDNLVEIRNFELSRFYGDIDLSLFDFKLDTQVGEVKNIIDLAKVVAEETITLTWTIEESHVLYAGYMAIQVRAFHGEVEKWHSAREYVLVMPSINPAAAQPDVLPSEFEQMELRVTTMKEQAEASAQTATEQANRAQGIADEFENETLPAAIAAVEAAVDEQVDIAASHADRAQGIADTFSNTTLPVAISAVEAAGQAKVDLAEQQAERVEDIIQEAEQDVLPELRQAIEDGIEAKELLDESIATGDLDSFKADYTQQRQQDNLKVVTMEKELNDYKSTMANVNVNQEPKQKVNGYGIVSLPKNAANGQVSCVVGGVTRTNIIPTDAVDWEQGSINASGTLVPSSNFLRTKISIQISPNTQYSKIINVSYKMQGFFYDKDNNFIADWGVDVKTVTTPATAAKANFRVQREPFVAEVPVSEIILAQPLVEYGSTAGSFISGTKSTNSVRVKSVGKNLFGGEHAADIIVSTVNNQTYAYKTVVDDRNCIALYGNGALLNKQILGNFKANTQYTFQAYVKGNGTNAGGYFRIQYTDGTNSTFANGLYATWTNVTFTSTNGKSIAGLYLTYGSGAINYFDYDTIQIEQGTTSTPYEPHKESISYINGAGELLSLPNGTYDEINISQGNMTQNVSEDIVVSDTVYDSLDTTTYTNVDVVITTAFADAKAGTTGADGQTHYYNKDGVELAEVAEADIDLEASAGKYYWGEDKKLYIIVAKGDYADIAAARTGLDATSLNYQLAMPVETPVQVSGTLVSYPSGTVYIEPFVADAGIYVDKMEVLYSDLPIKALEKISKVDFDTGLETELDITAAVIAEDKLSFTHPDLTSGDIVFFVYEHGAEGTIPETEISYYDSRYVIKGEDDKFYQWEIEAKLVEGVITPSIKLVEV